MRRRGQTVDYGFATGRVMVLRTRLLGHAAYERLLDAPTFDDQRRVLTETHFGRFLDGVHTASDVERAVDESLRDLYADFLHKAGLPEQVVSFFEAPYDFSALKGALRSRLPGVKVEAPGVTLGTVPAEAFDSPETLPGALGEVARAVIGVEAGPEETDVAVDAAMFAELARLAAEARIGLLVRLVARQADAANAKVLLRCAVAKRSATEARAMLVPGGAWDASRAAAHVGDPAALVAAIVSAKVLGAGPGGPEDLLDMERLDAVVAAATASIEAEAARGPIGPEPVIGYVLRRRAEAFVVRAVLVGRLAGLPRELVAARVGGIVVSELVAIVGDPISVAGFGPLGVAVFAVDDPAEARDLWPQLADGSYGVVFVTEPVYEAVADLAAETADRPVPAVTVIPGAGSPGGVGRQKIERAIVRALGTTVPFGSEEA